MKKMLFYFFFICMVVLPTAVGSAGVEDFTGTWKNVDRNTGGITTLKIKVNGDKIDVHAWGKCHPKDCDWGEVEAVAYGPSASSNLRQNANALTASYKTDFSRTQLVVKRAGSKKLRVEAFTRFKDKSGRNNYTKEYTFGRVRMQAVVPDTARPIRAVKEDCISFNPANTRVVRAQDRWKIADGNHWMFDFGNKKNEADRALRIIKHYRMDQSCFVGRPDPSLHYLLRSGRAPLGDIRGEDCVSFNPSTIEVKNVRGQWKIIDGNNWLFDFKGNEEEAKKAFRIIKNYGLNKSCFVGRPDPSFQYLRR